MQNFALFAFVFEDLKLSDVYDGFLFLAETVRNPPTLRPHRHVELEVNLVARGQVSYVVEGHRFTFGQRTLFWLFPEQEHQLVDRSRDAQYYVAVFKPAMIASVCHSDRYSDLRLTKLEGDGVLHTVLNPEAFDLVRRAMDALMVDGLPADVLNREAGYGFNSSFSYQHEDPDWLNTGLRHLLLLCWRQQSGWRIADHEIALNPAVRKVVSLLAEGDVDDLGHLSRQCGMSYTHLSRLFHQQMGLTLTRYRNSVRLARFWELYHEPTSRSLIETVFGAGFGSYAQFYRVFSEAYGSGPRAALGRALECDDA